MYGLLKYSEWVQTKDNEWILRPTKITGTKRDLEIIAECMILAIVEKINQSGSDYWTGRIPPRRSNHLPPNKQLHLIMQMAIKYLHDRDSILSRLTEEPDNPNIVSIPVISIGRID